MHLPRPHADIASLLASALSSANSALARSVAAAREWLPPTGDEPARAAPVALTRALFAQDSGDLLDAWNSETVSEVLTQLQFSLEVGGFTPGRVRNGSRVSSSKDLGRYISIDVKDPVLGNFTVRLWLLANWDTGLELILGAYHPARPAELMKYPPQVQRGLIALVSLAKLPVDWSNLTTDEAKSRIWDWQQRVLEVGAASSIDRHWPLLHAARDAAMAP